MADRPREHEVVIPIITLLVGLHRFLPPRNGMGRGLRLFVTRRPSPVALRLRSTELAVCASWSKRFGISRLVELGEYRVERPQAALSRC